MGDDPADRAIITPAPHRTLILVKVPCSIVSASGEIAKRAASDWPRALARLLFQFNHLSNCVSATGTLKSALNKTGLIWLNAGKPHWRAAL
jgi:hypothetical protein